MSIFIDPLDFALHLGRQLTEKSFIVSDGYFQPLGKEKNVM